LPNSNRSRRKRSITALFAAIVLAAALSLPARADDGTLPPFGIMPTRATLATILQAERRARGKPSAAGDVRIEDWNVTIGNTAGTLHRVVRGDDERSDLTLGTMHRASGRFRGRSWSQDYSGQVVTKTGVHRSDDISEAALASVRPATGVTLIGQTNQPVSAYVVKVAPPRGRLEYVFFDTHTGLIDRIEAADSGERVVTSYDDFHTTNGITRAWHVRITSPTSDQDERLVSLRYGAAVRGEDLAVPSSTRLLTFETPRVALPAKIVADRIIVTVRIKGRPVNLQLDSGASNVVLDQRVADALHLAQVGPFKQRTAGTYGTHLAALAQMTAGGIAAAGLVVEIAPFEEWADASTPVAGLLGYDFLSGCVLHLDYVNGTVEAIDPHAFVPPAGAAVVSIGLDDRIPIVPAIVGGARSAAFVLDTGADRSLVFARFVAAHPKRTADRGLGTEEQDAYPFTMYLSAVGGDISYRLLQIAPFSFAGYAFPQWLFGAPYDPAAFSVEDYDGLIGQDVLRNFDVYLDYPHLRIYLAPNARYRERWGV
jgi:hypothetical protein